MISVTQARQAYANGGPVFNGGSEAKSFGGEATLDGIFLECSFAFMVFKAGYG